MRFADALDSGGRGGRAARPPGRMRSVVRRQTAGSDPVGSSPSVFGNSRIAGRRSAAGLVGRELGARSPQAHESRDERDKEDLADQHLEDGEDLPDHA